MGVSFLILEMKKLVNFLKILKLYNKLKESLIKAKVFLLNGKKMILLFSKNV
jgi:sRNA-binding regulator protein Hfq